MSWGRSVSNNTAGSLRMPSVPQFQDQAAAMKALKETSSSRLTVIIDDTKCDAFFVYISESDPACSDIIKALNTKGRAYVYTHEHPNFLLRVAFKENVPNGHIVMSEVQAGNLHVCSKEPYEWRLFDNWDSLSTLHDLTLEVRHRFSVNKLSTINSKQLNSKCLKLLFGLVVTVNELFLIHFEGLELVCRLINLTPEKDDVEAEEEDDMILPDYYIGIVDAETRVYLEVDEAVCKSTLIIEGAVSKEASPPLKNIVNVTTSDDEIFPVKTKLLRPCLALTSAVQAGKGVYADAVKDVSVDIDCCTFDRILLFLEAQFKGHNFDILPEHLEEMSTAADMLKLQPLKDLCDRKRGAFESRVRREPIPYDEIVTRNRRIDGSEQETLLIMDGMVFDITRWLPEHPGGSTIIPEQALNMDSTVFFEIYHVSRQSFLYLKEFYIGELRDSDLAIVPKSRGESSAGFLAVLKAHTPWRLDLVKNAPTVKSF